MQKAITQSIQKSDCTGCGACYTICPKKCITLEAESDGFWYPQVNESQCMNCGLCERVCPSIHLPTNTCLPEMEVYACWNNDDQIRMDSSSGGVFSALAYHILDMGGYVCGVEHGNNFCAYHKLTNRPEDIERFRQSKYMQSRIDSVYAEIRDAVQNGIPVLFSGTPCQNAALRNIISDNPPNLYQCDFICRGVNSPKVFTKYLEWLADKYDSPVKEVRFRYKDKSHGWKQSYTKVTFKNNKSHIADKSDPFIQCFLKYNICMRLSCHNCKHRGLTRYADITIGDFWGVAHLDPNLDNDRGTSAVMLNTEKGIQLFQEISSTLTSRKCSLADVELNNPCLRKSPPEGKNRKSFFDDIDRYSFNMLQRKYCKEAFWNPPVRFGIRLIKHALEIVKLRISF